MTDKSWIGRNKAASKKKKPEDLPRCPECNMALQAGQTYCTTCHTEGMHGDPDHWVGEEMP